MRNITREAVEAFSVWDYFKKQNMLINNEWDWAIRIIKMYLHWNLIAQLEVNPYTKDNLYIYDCGYKTQTTKERLNWLLEYFELWELRQKKWQWYYIEYKGNINNWTETQELFEWSKNFIIW